MQADGNGMQYHWATVGFSAGGYDQLKGSKL